MAPTNKSSIIELSDGSDNDDINMDGPGSTLVTDNDDEGDGEESAEEAEESAEAELGQP